MTDVEQEVNTFLATLPAADVLDYLSNVAPVDKYGTEVAYLVTVIFLET